MTMVLRKRALRKLAMIATLPVVGCGSAGLDNSVSAKIPGTAGAAGARSAASSPRAAPIVTARSDAAREIRCPATLGGGVVPPGTRILQGAPPAAPLALSGGTVTANAPGDIKPKTYEMAELIPFDGPERRGRSVSSFDAFPSAALPHTLVCYYGERKVGALEGEATLLVPITPNGTYQCTVDTPVGNDRRPALAGCVGKGAVQSES